MDTKLEREECNDHRWGGDSFRFVLYFRIKEQPESKSDAVWSTTVAGEPPWENRSASVESYSGEWRSMELSGIPVGAKVLLTAHRGDQTIRDDVRLTISAPMKDRPIGRQVFRATLLVLAILIAYFTITAPFMIQ